MVEPKRRFSFIEALYWKALRKLDQSCDNRNAGS
jgi:hypothetical protein